VTEDTEILRAKSVPLSLCHHQYLTYVLGMEPGPPRWETDDWPHL